MAIYKKLELCLNRVSKYQKVFILPRAPFLIQVFRRMVCEVEIFSETLA